MPNLIARYIAALAILGVGDFVWLGYFGPAVVQPTLGPILREHIDWRGAIAFYLLYAAGLVIFAISPARAAGSWSLAALYGALFGFFCYMTYDATNFTTLSAWTLKLAVIDVAWGAFVSALAGLGGYAAAGAFHSS